MRTPAYHVLESPLHYILRLSEANGYSTPTVVMALAMNDEDSRVLARWNYARLNRVLPKCRHVPATFGYRWSGSNHICDLSLLGKYVLARHLHAPHAGICPECVAELGYLPAWWDLKYAVACPDHLRMFVNVCPTCSKPLSHLRCGLLSCSCGASLFTKSEEAPAAELLSLMQLLREKVEQVGSGVTTVRSARPLKPGDLSLGMLCRIIEAIGRTEQKMRAPDATSWSLPMQRKCLPVVASFLHGWPNGVPALCSRWHDHVTNTATIGTHRSFRTAFSWAFQWLFKAPGEQRNESLFVIEAVLRYGLSQHGASSLDVRSDDLKGLVQLDTEYCSVSKASELSGIARHTLSRLVKRNRVAYRVGRRGGRPMYEIKTEIARNLSLDYSPAMMFRDAAKYLGVTHNLYKGLRRSGVLQKRHATAHPEGIAIRDLDAFRCTMIATARTTGRAEGTASLDTLRHERCPRKAMLQIIKQVLERRIRCYRTRALPRRIDELRVRRRDVAPIIAACTPPAPATIKQFQARYNLSYCETRTLAYHLAERKVTARMLPSTLLDDVKFDEFMRRHIGLAAYARQQGIGYRAALNGLLKSNAKVLKIAVTLRPQKFVYFVPLT
jgi:hypothetical protein